jgi:hypothetical protein
MRSGRRAACTAALWLALGGISGIAGCAAPTPGRVADSQASFDRTYDVALGAMADQRMTFSTQDRLQGRIVGSVDGITLSATIQPIVDGTTRVSFEAGGNTEADVAMLKRVADAYNARMSKLGLLGGFKDGAEANQKGPIPCPSGPAFCP